MKVSGNFKEPVLTRSHSSKGFGWGTVSGQLRQVDHPRNPTTCMLYITFSFIGAYRYYLSTWTQYAELELKNPY